MLKRLFDIVCSLIGIVAIAPLLLIIAISIVLTDGFPVLFKQSRVGKNQVLFKLYKFRTMSVNSEKLGQLSVGVRDPRVTNIGQFLRKLKLDELPQLFNILKGDMSFVGPRPEVPRYVSLYNTDQLKVLSVRPGLTDPASLAYFNESELLSKSTNPEETYIQEVLPEKLRLNMEYVNRRSFGSDIGLIFKTILRIFIK